MRRIFLDNNATTGVDPRVVEAMMEDLGGIPANPSSVHFFGQEAKKKVVRAKESLAHNLHIKPQELTFTSGGSEALRLLLCTLYNKSPGCHIIASSAEHPATLKTLAYLETQGGRVTYLPVGLWGAVRPEQIQEALTPATRLITLMSINNVTGVKTDIGSIANLAHKAEIPFVVDAVQHLGKELFKIPLGVTGMAFSGHKLHGPKGIGLAFLRAPFKIDSPFHTGTENLAGILGFAKAVDLLNTELPAATFHMEKLRNHLIDGLSARLGNIVVHGQGPRICNTAHIAFPGADGEALLIQLDLAGIAVSHGSACASGGLEPSHVLIAMGIPPSVARTSLRFSLSRTTTQLDIDTTLDILTDLLH
jgi:cysteine desulfurase